VSGFIDRAWLGELTGLKCHIFRYAGLDDHDYFCTTRLESTSLCGLPCSSIHFLRRVKKYSSSVSYYLFSCPHH
jgi:hypothetical protein